MMMFVCDLEIIKRNEILIKDNEIHSKLMWEDIISKNSTKFHIILKSRTVSINSFRNPWKCGKLLLIATLTLLKVLPMWKLENFSKSHHQSIQIILFIRYVVIRGNLECTRRKPYKIFWKPCEIFCFPEINKTSNKNMI